jgi:hypothetical protein
LIGTLVLQPLYSSLADADAATELAQLTAAADQASLKLFDALQVIVDFLCNQSEFVT